MHLDFKLSEELDEGENKKAQFQWEHEYYGICEDRDHQWTSSMLDSSHSGTRLGDSWAEPDKVSQADCTPARPTQSPYCVTRPENNLERCRQDHLIEASGVFSSPRERVSTTRDLYLAEGRVKH